MESEDELLRKWQDGDSRAGETFVARHYVSVYRFFANKVPNEADDLTQRTFTDLHQSVARVRSAPSLRAYVMTIARNNLYMLLRSRAVHGRAFDPNRDPASEGVDDGTPSKLLARRQEERLLLAGLRRIPLSAQIVLELYYWEAMSVAEIACVTRVQPGTVMSRLARARTLLRETIGALEADAHAIASTLAELDGWAAAVRERALQRRP